MTIRYTFFAAVAVAVFAAAYYLRTGEMEPTGEALADVTVPQLTAEQKQGENLFNANCSSCHGVNAAGKDGLAPPLIHKIYEPSHHGDMAFVLAAKQGVRQHHWQFGNMLPVEGITDDELSKIINHVRTLQRANGIE